MKRLVLGNFADYVAGLHVVSFLGCCLELPFQIVVKARHYGAALYEVAHLGLKDRKGALYAVVY